MSHAETASEINRHNVSKFGEVFTPSNIVNDMLDLVAHECERVDSRFLEPACGDGNFLAEVLRRRLVVVTNRRRRAINLWEQDALLGLACLYGVELLATNVTMCRQRLFEIFRDTYSDHFGNLCRDAVVSAAQNIVNTNILRGDAVAMTSTDDSDASAKPLVFSEWSMLSGGLFKRRLFEYRRLVRSIEGTNSEMFGDRPDAIDSDHGATVFIEKPLCDLPLIHYLKLGEEGPVDDHA
jgi:hypothetical protein